MNYNVIIGKSVAYAKKTGAGVLLANDKYDTVVANLIVGGIVLMQTGGTAEGAIIVASDIDADSKDFTLVSKYPSSEPAGFSIVKSEPMDAASFKRAFGAYTAPAAKAIEIGLTGTAPTGSLNVPAITEGDVYELVVSDIPVIGMRETAQKRITEVANAIDTVTTIMTRLVAQFNSKVNYATATMHLTATVADGISIVGTAGYNFNVTPIETLGYATVASAGYNLGCGTNAQTLKIEAGGLAETGQNNTYSRAERGVWTEPSMVEAGVNYDIFTLTWTDPREGEVSNKDTYKQTLKTCLPEGAAASTTFNSIVDALV